MTDKEVLEAIRVVMDKGFATESKGVMALMFEQADVLDDIEVLLTENGYPSTISFEDSNV